MVKPESFEICPSASLSAQITSFQLSQFPTILEKLVCHFATPEPESVPLLHRRANKEGEYSTGFPFLGLCDDWEAFQNGNQPPLCGRREAGKGSEYCMHSARFIADVFKCAEGLSGNCRRIVMHSCHWASDLFLLLLLLLLPVCAFVGAAAASSSSSPSKTLGPTRRQMRTRGGSRGTGSGALLDRGLAAQMQTVPIG